MIAGVLCLACWLVVVCGLFLLLWVAVGVGLASLVPVRCPGLFVVSALGSPVLVGVPCWCCRMSGCHCGRCVCGVGGVLWAALVAVCRFLALVKSSGTG